MMTSRIRGGAVTQSGMCLAEQGERPGLKQRRPQFAVSARSLLRHGDGLPRVTAGQGELTQAEQDPRLGQIQGKLTRLRASLHASCCHSSNPA
jgi:hypothetical protein